MWVSFGSYFMFSNFYRWHLHNANRVAWGSQWWNINNNRIENCLPPLSHNYWKYVYVDFLVLCIGSPSCVHYWFEAINKRWRYSSIKVKTFFLLVFVIDPHQTTHIAYETRPLISEALEDWKQMSNNCLNTRKSKMSCMQDLQELLKT